MVMEHLPEEFGAIEPLLPVWGFATENERSEKRWRCSPQDFQSFYDAMMPHLPRVLEFLAGYGTADPPPEVRNLARLALAFAEASPHTEMYKNSTQVPNSFEARRFVAVHGARER